MSNKMKAAFFLWLSASQFIMVLVWVYLWTRGQELIKNLCDLVWTQRGITGTFPLPCGLFWSGDAAHHILSTHTHKIRNTRLYSATTSFENTPKLHIPLRKTLPSECDSGTSVSTVCDDSKLLSASRREAFLSVCRWIIHVMMNAESRATLFPCGSHGICVLLRYALFYLFFFSMGGFNSFLKNLTERKSQSWRGAKQKKITENDRWEKSKSLGEEDEKTDDDDMKPSVAALSARSVQQPAETPRVHETSVNRETLITAGDDGAFKRWSRE